MLLVSWLALRTVLTLMMYPEAHLHFYALHNRPGGFLCTEPRSVGLPHPTTPDLTRPDICRADLFRTASQTTASTACFLHQQRNKQPIFCSSQVVGQLPPQHNAAQHTRLGLIASYRHRPLDNYVPTSARSPAVYVQNVSQAEREYSLPAHGSCSDSRVCLLSAPTSYSNLVLVDGASESIRTD